jgi:hypothetical protein
MKIRLARSAMKHQPSVGTTPAAITVFESDGRHADDFR